MTSSEIVPNQNGDIKPVVTSKAGNIRDKFEKSMTEEKPQKKKRPTRVKYAGVNSAKNKFMEEAERINAPKDDKERGIRQITPPPNGVSVGVLESQPQARAPGIVSADDEKPDDILSLSEYTRKLKAKFKQLESGEQQEDIRHAISAIEEFEMEAVRAKKSMWKDIESGKRQNETVERKKIDLTDGATNGGVYENEPEVNPDVVKYSYSKDILTSGSTKDKLEMLLNTSALKKVNKISPAEELKILSELEKNSVYENKPMDRNQDVVGADTQDLEDYKTLKTTKSTREKFLDGSVFKNEVKKTVVEIANDSGGVYENEPMRRTDVVRHDDSPENDQNQDQKAKWASEAKKRLLEQQAQNSVQVEKKETLSGGKFATEAREKFLQKQREIEEQEKTKATPKIIDIWSEMTPCSGVFENKPAPRSKDIVVCGQSSDEEEEGHEQQGSTRS